VIAGTTLHTNTEDTQRRTLTIPEAAAVIGISRAAAYELAKENRLPVPVIRAGKRLLVSRAALEEVLSRQHSESTQAA